MDSEVAQERASKRQRIEDAPDANLSTSERENILAAADRAVRTTAFSSRRLNGKGRVSSPATSSPLVSLVTNDVASPPSPSSSPSPSPSLASVSAPVTVPTPTTTTTTYSSSSSSSSSSSVGSSSSSASTTDNTTTRPTRSTLKPLASNIASTKKPSSNTFIVTALQELRRVEEDTRNQQDVAYLEREVEHLRRGLASRDVIIQRLRDEVEEKDRILKSLPRELVVNWVVTQRMMTRQAVNVDVLNTL